LIGLYLLEKKLVFFGFVAFSKAYNRPNIEFIKQNYKNSFEKSLNFVSLFGGYTKDLKPF